MNRRSQKFRLGIFVTIGFLLLISLVAFFTSQHLFEKSDTYYVSYQDVSVSGLEVGSPVKYLGIKAGTISDITINPKDVNSIIVELKLEPSTPVKKDTKANIVSRGITGLKTIEIRGGSNKAKSLDEGSFIQAGSSITAKITGKAEVIAEKAEMVLNNFQRFSRPENVKKFTKAAEDISTLMERAELTAARVDTIVMNNRDTLRMAIHSIHHLTETLDKSFRGIQRLVENDTIDEILANTRDFSAALKETDMKVLIKDLSGLIKQTHILLSNADNDINQSSETLKRNLELLKYTLENLNEASRKINSNPSILIRTQEKKDIPDKHLKN